MNREDIFLAAPVYKLSDYQSVLSQVLSSPPAAAVNTAEVLEVLEMPRQIVDSMNASYGLPRSLQKELNFFKKPQFMLRQSTVDLIRSVIPAELSKPAEQRHRIRISGKQGCGKTVQMIQLMQHYVGERWICLHMPTFFWLLTGAAPYSLNEKKGMYDLPEATASLLEYFEKINGEVLTTVKLTQSYGEELGGGKAGVDTLRSLLSFKADKPIAVFDALINELALQQHFSVFVGIDMENALYHSTQYTDQQSNKLYPSQFGLTAKLLDLVKGQIKLKNGVVVTSTSGRVLCREHEQLSLEESNRTAKEQQAVDYELKNFSLKETDSLLRYHSRAGFIPREVLCDQYIQKAYLMTGGNGWQLFQMGIERPLLH